MWRGARRYLQVDVLINSLNPYRSSKSSLEKNTWIGWFCSNWVNVDRAPEHLCQWKRLLHRHRHSGHRSRAPVPMICEPLCAHRHLSVWSSRFSRPWVEQWSYWIIHIIYRTHLKVMKTSLLPTGILTVWPSSIPAGTGTDTWYYSSSRDCSRSEADKDLLSMVGLAMAFTIWTRILVPCSLALTPPDEEVDQTHWAITITKTCLLTCKYFSSWKAQ